MTVTGFQFRFLLLIQLEICRNPEFPAGSDIRQAVSAWLLHDGLCRNRPAAEIWNAELFIQMHGPDDRQTVSADDASFKCPVSVDVPAEGTEIAHFSTSLLIFCGLTDASFQHPVRLLIFQHAVSDRPDASGFIIEKGE